MSCVPVPADGQDECDLPLASHPNWTSTRERLETRLVQPPFCDVVSLEREIPSVAQRPEIAR